MTLVVAALGRESIWISADRRLSAGGKPLSDDAVKVMSLVRGSDSALLGYAGLGRTPEGKQPSDWMNTTLRGRNAPLERSLEILADAILAKIPRHLRQVPGLGDRAHVVLAPAFVDERPVLYSLELDLVQSTGQARVFAHRHHVAERARNPRVGLAGSGGPFLKGRRAALVRLLRLILKHERNRVSAQVVAREFAKMNDEVAKLEASVGPDCVVAWTYRRNGPLKGGGGSQSFRGSIPRTDEGLIIPINANGADVSSLLKAIRPHSFAHLDSLLSGSEEKHHLDAMSEAVSKLSGKTDDTL